MITCFLYGFDVIFTPLESVEQILSVVESAEESVYVTSYSVDHPEVIQSLDYLASRGVDVRAITETPFAASNIKMKIDVEKSLFHMKTIILDDHTAILSSANFTVHSLKESYNDLIIVSSKKFASQLKQFFLEMWAGRDFSLNAEAEGLRVFTHDIENEVLNRISQAKKSVCIAMYALTHPELWAILKILNCRGVNVRVVTDKWFLTNSPIAQIPSESFEVRVVKSRTLHSKLIIVDGKCVITGSANATKSGYNSNAELAVVVTDEAVVNEYISYFEHLFKEGESF